jgi:branched-chain amino acid aminotransferase
MNVAFLNKKKIDPSGKVSLYNPSFLYGINCFEGVRAYWNQHSEKMSFFDLQEHLLRMYASARFLSFNIHISINELTQHLYDIIEKEQIKEDIYVRVTFFIGEDTSWSDTNNINLLVSMRSLKSELGKSVPIVLSITSFARISSASMPPSVKAGANYLNSRYALLESIRKGYDGALFMSAQGYISESTGSCIFFIRNGIVYTPSEDCDILVGITRNRIIELCKKNNIEVQQLRMPGASIYTFESAFLAGTMIEIKPISRIENMDYDVHNPILQKITNALTDYIYEMDI